MDEYSFSAIFLKFEREKNCVLVKLSKTQNTPHKTNLV